METTATRSSSARALAGITTGRNPRAASARRVRSEWYGFPPPPAPRIQAPAARSSISVGVSSLVPWVMRAPMLAETELRQSSRWRRGTVRRSRAKRGLLTRVKRAVLAARREYPAPALDNNRVFSPLRSVSWRRL